MPIQIKSLTPLAEFMDMLYTRCATDLSPIPNMRWWLELRPPVTPNEGNGIVYIKGMKYDSDGSRIIEHRAVFDAVQHGADVPSSELEIAAQYHIDHFKSKVVGHG